MREGRILLVDDDAQILRVLGMSLRAAGFDVHTAEGATDALELSSAHAFTAVVVDQRLHDGTGLGVLASILAANPRVPAILSSGNISAELSAQAQKLGARTLEKPYPVSTLLSLLDSLK
jgi:two-component system response regulator GlrR